MTMWRLRVRRMLLAAGLLCDYVVIAGVADAGGGGGSHVTMWRLRVRRMLVAAGLSCDYVVIAGAADAGGGGARM